MKKINRYVSFFEYSGIDKTKHEIKAFNEKNRNVKIVITPQIAPQKDYYKLDLQKDKTSLSIKPIEIADGPSEFPLIPISYLDKTDGDYTCFLYESNDNNSTLTVGAEGGD